MKRRYETDLAEVCSRLNAHGAKYVLVGAAAMQVWGTTRATRDIDILIDASERNARKVLAALSEMGFGMAKEFLAAEVATKPVTVIGDMPRVDLFTLAWAVRYPEAARDATVFEVERVKIPTASLDHLIASKRTGRLQDAADIELLEEIKRIRANADG